MLRSVYLEGEMGEKFGTGFQISASKVSDVVKCIDCNHPSFRKYLMDCHEQEIGFEVDIAKSKLDYDVELLMNIKEGDVTITPIPAGSKSGGAKIFAAIAILAAVVFTGGGAAMLAGEAAKGWAVTTAAGATTASLSMPGMMAVMLAVNVGMMGLSQVMAPDPATDADQEESYLFNGNQQNIVEGDPVPVLYGKLRVPGQPINFEVSGAGTEPKRTIAVTQWSASAVGI